MKYGISEVTIMYMLHISFCRRNDKVQIST